MAQYEPGYREQQAAYGGERYGEWGPGFEGRERFGPREGRFEGSYGSGGWGHTDMGPGGGYGYGGYGGYSGTSVEAGGRFGGGYNPGGSFTNYGGFAAGQAQYGAGYAPTGFAGTGYGGRYADFGPGRREFGPGEFERREWTASAYGPESRAWAGERPWGYEQRRFEGGRHERFGSFEPGRWAPPGGTQFGERRYGPY